MSSSQVAEVQVDIRSRLAHGCERITLVLLFGFALAAPHSIAGSQGGFLAAAFFWLLSAAFAGRISIRRTPLDWPLLGLFAWATLSACFSYEPKVSLNGLKGLAFFSTFYLVATRTANTGRNRQLALTLICSCLFNVGFTVYQKVIGQGLRIVSASPDSRLMKLGFVPGDVLLTADGKLITSLQMLSDLVDAGPEESKIRLSFRHGEMPLELEMPRRRFQRHTELKGPARFEIETAPARDFRAHGFYNHYATYAEVLQLIASLCFGFLLACPRRWQYLLGFGLASLALTAALIFTATRAPLVALMASLMVMLFMSQGMRRYLLIGVVVVALPLGLFAITKWRGVGFIDKNDGSTTWRLEIWQEGLKLCSQHPIFGIGKGSERKHWREWGLYRNGELPPGHFHSSPLQIAVWWGIPATLLFWAVMFQAARMMYRFLRDRRAQVATAVPETVRQPESDSLLNTGVWQQQALILGALGGLIGFNISALVHFNFGDGEVVMVLWLILGLAMAEILTAQRAKSLSLAASG